MKFAKKYMKGMQAELPGVGLKRLKKMFKKCRSEPGSHHEPGPSSDADASRRCPGHCSGEGRRAAKSGPMLLNVLEGYLKYENLSQTRMTGRRMINSKSNQTLNTAHRNMRRPPSFSSLGVVHLPNVGRLYLGQCHHRSHRYQNAEVDLQLPIQEKIEYNWGYDADDISEEVLRASSALQNIQLDQKAQNLTSWSHPGDGAE